MARLLGQVDLALFQPAQQFIGRQVDQHDLAGAVEDRVGHGLPHADAGDAADGLVEALEVLHVDRGPHVDAGRLQLLDVLPALGMAAARRVGMRQFVDQHQRGMAGQRRVQVELAQHPLAVRHRLHRQALDAVDQCFGFGAAVGLDHADEDVDALCRRRARRGKHGKGLADARRCAEVDPELAARCPGSFSLHLPEQGIGIGTCAGGAEFGIRHGKVRIPC
ncbi:hypothetical protein D3C72_1488650 [compost metagenome]